MNEYDSTKGSTAVGNRTKHIGDYKPRGKPFPKKGEDPEFDKERAERNARNSAKGNAVKKELKKHKKKQFWEDQIAGYLSQEGKGNAGIDILNEIDRLIQSSTNDNTIKELIKIKVGMLGLSAPSTKPEEEVVEEKSENIDELKAKLSALGIDVGDRNGENT